MSASGVPASRYGASRQPLALPTMPAITIGSGPPRPRPAAHQACSDAANPTLHREQPLIVRVLREHLAARAEPPGAAVARAPVDAEQRRPCAIVHGKYCITNEPPNRTLAAHATRLPHRRHLPRPQPARAGGAGTRRPHRGRALPAGGDPAERGGAVRRAEGQPHRAARGDQGAGGQGLGGIEAAHRHAGARHRPVEPARPRRARLALPHAARPAPAGAADRDARDHRARRGAAGRAPPQRRATRRDGARAVRHGRRQTHRPVGAGRSGVPPRRSSTPPATAC